MQKIFRVNIKQVGLASAYITASTAEEAKEKVEQLMENGAIEIVLEPGSEWEEQEIIATDDCGDDSQKNYDNMSREEFDSLEMNNIKWTEAEEENNS